MPDRRGATMLEDLPEEILDMILIRLPSKDIGRCRVVNTSWCSVTSTPKFMLEHHRRQPSLPIVDGRGRPASYVVFGDAGAGTSNQQLWPFLKHHSKIWPEITCDGFIVVSRASRVYICNPVIRKYAILPLLLFGQGIENNIIGFYRHDPTGEYRVLWVSYSHHSTKYSLYVLTVGSDMPRLVGVRMPTGSPSSMEQKLLKGLGPSSCLPAILHRGNLHWSTYGGAVVARSITGGGGDIIVFDTEAEIFRWMRGPGLSCPHRRLCKMKGTLAFWGGFRSTVMDVWVMQDYEAEIWAFKYRIDLSTVEASRQLYLTMIKRKMRTPLNSTVQWFNAISVLNERELLILFNSKHVLRCDIDGKFLGMANIGKGQYCMALSHFRLQESIIPIPSHEMQEDEELLFSTEDL